MFRILCVFRLVCLFVFAVCYICLYYVMRTFNVLLIKGNSLTYCQKDQQKLSPDEGNPFQVPSSFVPSNMFGP